jgi:ATP-binding cassette subfamily B protein
MFTTVVLIGGAFFAIAPSVAWLAFLPVPIIIWGSFRFQRRIEPRYAAVREQAAAINSQLANNLGGIATIKAFTAEQREVERISIESDRYREANAAAITLSSAFSPLIRVAILIGFTATLVRGGFLVLDGALEIGLYSVMVFLTQRLLWPLTRLGQTFDLYQRAMASSRRIFSVLDTEPNIHDGPDEPGPVRGSLSLSSVTFAYTEGISALSDVTIDIPAGRTTAFVGPTGSGKTTLVKLLLRFYDPATGTVALDGVDLRTLTRAGLRRSMALVSQDVFLFHGTVAENIAYGKPGASPDDVETAARTAEAHAFITSLPDGYDTIIGERGQKLSGGQRQRLSIARALVANSPILLLDEATSAVDNETEAAIQRSLARVARDRTVVVIAHRLSTIRHADRIYVISDGSVVDSGTHDALVERPGIYRSLWNVQTGEAVDL